jgi:hypothetical protein
MLKVNSRGDNYISPLINDKGEHLDEQGYLVGSVKSIHLMRLFFATCNVNPNRKNENASFDNILPKRFHAH